MQSKILGVIFDLDGVLVATDRFHFRSWAQLAQEESLHFDEDLYASRMRGVARMESLEALLDASRDRLPHALTQPEKRAFADRKNRTYQELIGSLSAADLLPGAKSMLGELRNGGIKTALGSSSLNAALILKRVGLVGLFDATADGTDVTRSKPDPEVFLLAAKRLKLVPSQCLVVEDSVAGIEAARRAGMPYFGIGQPKTLPGVAHIAPTLAEVTVEELLSVGVPGSTG